MQRTDSEEEEYSVTFTQFRECLNKGDVDLSLLTHPPTPNASLPLTQTENLKRKMECYSEYK